jgi:hypothetical protein
MLRSQFLVLRRRGVMTGEPGLIGLLYGAD